MSRDPKQIGMSIWIGQVWCDKHIYCSGNLSPLYKEIPNALLAVRMMAYVFTNHYLRLDSLLAI